MSRSRAPSAGTQTVLPAPQRSLSYNTETHHNASSTQASATHITSSSHHTHDGSLHAAASRARQDTLRVYAASKFTTDGKRVYPSPALAQSELPQYQRLHHSSVLPSPLFDTWAQSASATETQCKEQLVPTEYKDATFKASRVHLTPEPLQPRRSAHVAVPRMSQHEAHARVHAMPNDIIMSNALNSASVAAKMQAHRAVLDITHANQDFATEQDMTSQGNRWDAGTAERSRALSLHVSEAGRHTAEGSRRVSAAEASVLFDQEMST